MCAHCRARGTIIGSSSPGRELVSSSASFALAAHYGTPLARSNREEYKAERGAGARPSLGPINRNERRVGEFAARTDDI